MRPEDGLRFETLAIRRHLLKQRGENVYKMLSNKLNSLLFSKISKDMYLTKYVSFLSLIRHF